MPTIFTGKNSGGKHGKGFLDAVDRAAEKLQINPDWLMGVMHKETKGTFSASIKNPKSSATGLIQILEFNAKSLGTTTQLLSKMSAEEQMVYVQKYFENNIKSYGRPKSYEDTYMMVFNPANMNKPDSAILYQKGSDGFKLNQVANTNGDNFITKGEFTKKYAYSGMSENEKVKLMQGTNTNPNPQPFTEEKIEESKPLPNFEEYAAKSQAVYDMNELDDRLGNGFSQLQQVGNNMPKNGSYKGAPSVFNDYALFRFYGIKDANELFDGRNGPETGRNGRYVSSSWKNPIAQNLIEQGEKPGHRQFPYAWSDFLYCKHYGIVPNNHMITLRRYPLPTYDHGLVSSATTEADGKLKFGTKEDAHQLPVAQAVTWMGEDTGNKLDDLFKFTTGMKWEPKTAEVNSVSPNNVGAGGGGTGMGKFASVLGVLTGQATGSTVSGEAEQIAKFDPYDSQDGPLKYKVYGPVNVIDTTYIRGRGLTFEHDFKLVFEYSLKSIGGLNPKMAMLDILGNILSLTFNNAKFWGGANRFFPNVPAYPFLGSQKLWFDRDPGNYVKSVFQQMGNAAGNIGDFFSMLSGGGMMDAIKGLLSGGASLGMGMLQNSHRPEILSIPGLLTGQPVGEWHMVIGNPLNPIAMVGNLIVDSTDFEFNNALGFDDFPTEMKVTINLKHGRPRDKGDIESMFNQGQGRLYYAYENQLEPWNRASSTRNSTNSTNGGVSRSGNLEGVETWNGKNFQNKSTTIDINQSLKYAKEFGIDVSERVTGKKNYSTADEHEKKAIINAVRDGGGAD